MIPQHKAELSNNICWRKLGVVKGISALEAQRQLQVKEQEAQGLPVYQKVIDLQAGNTWLHENSVTTNSQPSVTTATMNVQSQVSSHTIEQSDTSAKLRSMEQEVARQQKLVHDAQQHVNQLQNSLSNMRQVALSLGVDLPPELDSFGFTTLPNPLSWYGKANNTNQDTQPQVASPPSKTTAQDPVSAAAETDNALKTEAIAVPLTVFDGLPSPDKFFENSNLPLREKVRLARESAEAYGRGSSPRAWRSSADSEGQMGKTPNSFVVASQRNRALSSLATTHVSPDMLTVFHT